jgi:hypothetical protein
MDMCGLLFLYGQGTGGQQGGLARVGGHGKGPGGEGRAGKDPHRQGGPARAGRGTGGGGPARVRGGMGEERPTSPLCTGFTLVLLND